MRKCELMSWEKYSFKDLVEATLLFARLATDVFILHKLCVFIVLPAYLYSNANIRIHTLLTSIGYTDMKNRIVDYSGNWGSRIVAEE